jgi:hypothetical protein
VTAWTGVTRPTRDLEGVKLVLHGREFALFDV